MGVWVWGVRGVGGEAGEYRESEKSHFVPLKSLNWWWEFDVWCEG